MWKVERPVSSTFVCSHLLAAPDVQYLFITMANRLLQKRCAVLLKLFKLPSDLKALWPWKISKCNTFVKFCWLFTRNWQNVFSLRYEHTAATKILDINPFLVIHFEVSVSIFLRIYCSETWLCWSPLLAVKTAKIIEVAKSHGLIQNKFSSSHRVYLHICINCMKRRKRYVRNAAL